MRFNPSWMNDRVDSNWLLSSSSAPFMTATDMFADPNERATRRQATSSKGAGEVKEVDGNAALDDVYNTKFNVDCTGGSPKLLAKVYQTPSDSSSAPLPKHMAKPPRDKPSEHQSNDSFDVGLQQSDIDHGFPADVQFAASELTGMDAAEELGSLAVDMHFDGVPGRRNRDRDSFSSFESQTQEIERSLSKSMSHEAAPERRSSLSNSIGSLGDIMLEPH